MKINRRLLVTAAALAASAVALLGVSAASAQTSGDVRADSTWGRQAPADSTWGFVSDPDSVGVLNTTTLDSTW